MIFHRESPWAWREYGLDAKFLNEPKRSVDDSQMYLSLIKPNPQMSASWDKLDGYSIESTYIECLELQSNFCVLFNLILQSSNEIGPIM